MIDTPGEFILHRQYYNALNVTAAEADVIGFKNKYHLPVVKNPCPADGATKREYIKQLIRTINHENPGTKTRLFTALINGHIPDWEDQNE